MRIWASVHTAVQQRLLSLCNLLIVVLAVAMSDLCSVPSFRVGAASAAAGLLTLYTLGTRVSTHLTCVLFLVAVLSLLRDAIILVPSELSDQLDQARGGASAVVLLAICISGWLGSRPAEDLPHRLKLLTFSLMEATVVSDNFLRFARTRDEADLLFPSFHWHAPFVAFFIAGLRTRRALRACGMH